MNVATSAITDLIDRVDRLERIVRKLAVAEIERNQFNAEYRFRNTFDSFLGPVSGGYSMEYKDGIVVDGK